MKLIMVNVLLVLSTICYSFFGHASIIGLEHRSSDNPFTISTVNVEGDLKFRIHMPHTFQCGELHLGRYSRLPSVEDLEGHGYGPILGIWVPADCIGRTVPMGEVQDEFSLDEIFSSKPSLKDQFIAGKTQITFVFHEDNGDPEPPFANAKYWISDFSPLSMLFQKLRFW